MMHKEIDRVVVEVSNDKMANNTYSVIVHTPTSNEYKIKLRDEKINSMVKEFLTKDYGKMDGLIYDLMESKSPEAFGHTLAKPGNTQNHNQVIDLDAEPVEGPIQCLLCGKTENAHLNNPLVYNVCPVCYQKQEELLQQSK